VQSDGGVMVRVCEGERSVEEEGMETLSAISESERSSPPSKLSVFMSSVSD